MHQNVPSNNQNSKFNLNKSYATINRDIIQWAINAPYLEKGHERALAAKWKTSQDTKALNDIGSAHMRLVIATANKFKRFNLPMADLVQEGYIGLLEAASRFDPEREVRFSTYASWWIRASIQDYILRNWSIVRGGTSSAQKSLFFNLRRLRNQLSVESNNLTTEEIYKTLASHFGVSISDVATMDARLSASDNSLNATVGHDDDNTATKMDQLVDLAPLQDTVVADEIDGNRRSQWLHEAMKSLNEREIFIIKMRRLKEQAETLEFLGEHLGISKERVRQIESRAMEKLRAALLKKHEEEIFTCS